MCPKRNDSHFLESGYPQAYTDFLYITHNSVPKYIEPSQKYINDLQNAAVVKKAGFDQSKENLTDVKEKLIEAETYICDEEISHGIDVYMGLADRFIREFYQYHVAAYLYKKCISLSQQAEDVRLEALSEMGYAKCHDLFDRSDAAIHNLEKAISKANDPDTISKVSGELIDIYQKLCDKYEAEAKGYDSNIQSALKYYQKCLDVCKKSE